MPHSTGRASGPSPQLQTPAERAGATLPWWARALDVATVLLVTVSALVFLFGGFREPIAGIRVSVTSEWRVLAAALVAAAIRHLAVRAEPLPHRLRTGARRLRRSRAISEAVGPVVSTRIAVLVVGYLATVAIGFPPDGAAFHISGNAFLNLPARWDAGWYLQIVQRGYMWNGNAGYQQNVVFFPLFPSLMYVQGLFIGRQWLMAGTILAIAAFLWALVYLFRFARDRYGDDAARAVLWLVAAYPFAVYFSAPYTESLYMLCVLGACYHFERGEPGRAALWGIMVGLCRPNGFLLSGTLALLLIPSVWPRARAGWLGRLLMGGSSRTEVRRDRSSVPWQVVAVAGPLMGVTLYSAYLYYRFGDPLIWMQGQVAWGRVFEGVGPGIDALVGDSQTLLSAEGIYDYSVSNPVDLLNTLAAVFAIAGLVPVVWRLGLAYGAFVAINIFPPLLVGGMLSIGRMTSVLFPLFVWLGWRVPAGYRASVIVAFAMLQALIAALFYTWRPAF
jgi:hypothetical protein